MENMNQSEMNLEVMNVYAVAFKYCTGCFINDYETSIDNKPVSAESNKLLEDFKKNCHKIDAVVKNLDDETVRWVFSALLQKELGKYILPLYLHFAHSTCSVDYVPGILSSEEETCVKEHLSELKESILQIFIENYYVLQGDDYKEDLGELLVKLNDQKNERLKIYASSMPFCLADKFPSATIVGIEKDPLIRDCFNLLTANGDCNISLFKSEQEILNTYNNNIKFDVILAVEPGTKAGLVDEETLSSFYNERLKEEGVLYAIVRNGYLTRRVLKEERTSFLQEIVKSLVVDKIIQFPTNFLESVTEGVSLLEIRKTDRISPIENELKDRNKTDDLDFWKSFCWKRSSLFIFKAESNGDIPGSLNLDSLFHELDYPYSEYRIEDDLRYNNCLDYHNSRELKYDTIADFGGILLPDYYLNQYLYKEKKMSSIVSAANVSETEATKDHPLRILSTSNMSQIAIGRPIDIASLTEETTGTYKTVCGPCVVLNRFDSEVYTAIIESNNVVAIPDEALVFTCFDMQYLDCLLHDGKSCLYSCTSEAYPLTEDLYLYSIIDDKNRDEISGYTIRRLGENIKALELRIKIAYEEYQQQIRARKHAMSQVVSAISSTWNTINRRMQKNGSLSLDEYIGVTNPIKVEGLFKSVDSMLESLSKQTAHLADVEYDWGKFETINVVEYLNTYAANHPYPSFKYVFADNMHAHDDVKIKANKIALDRVLDSIVNNAISHGFTDSSRLDYAIKFELYRIENSIKIFISNNGNPLPEEFRHNPNKIKMFGVSTSPNKDGHSGIGCGDAENIIKQLNGRMDICRVGGFRDGYTVSYLLVFPISKK